MDVSQHLDSTRVLSLHDHNCSNCGYLKNNLNRCKICVSGLHSIYHYYVAFIYSYSWKEENLHYCFTSSTTYLVFTTIAKDVMKSISYQFIIAFIQVIKLSRHQVINWEENSFFNEVRVLDLATSCHYTSISLKLEFTLINNARFDFPH